MRRRKNIERVIEDIAREIKRKLIARAGGQLPRTVRGWRRLAYDCHIQTWPDFDCRPKFEASADYYPERGYWIITYNPYMDDREIRKSICHELFEIYAHWLHGSLFAHYDRHITLAYAGELDPADTRHRIAIRGEQICFRDRKPGRH